MWTAALPLPGATSATWSSRAPGCRWSRPD